MTKQIITTQQIANLKDSMFYFRIGLLSFIFSIPPQATFFVLEYYKMQYNTLGFLSNYFSEALFAFGLICFAVGAYFILECGVLEMLKEEFSDKTN